MWDRLDEWKQRAVALLFFAGLVWAVFGNLNTVFHMDAEASELWAANARETACRDAWSLDEKILAAEIRLATEQLSAEARALITAQIQAWRSKREAIRSQYGC